MVYVAAPLGHLPSYYIFLVANQPSHSHIRHDTDRLTIEQILARLQASILIKKNNFLAVVSKNYIPADIIC